MKDEDRKQRILLVDDHPILCEGLAQRINSESDLEVCGQARDAHAALIAIDKLKPDVAIVDIALGNTSGVELIKDIKVRHPKLPVLVLSMHNEALYAERSLRAGAKGYVMKQEEPEVLLRAISHVLRGQIFLSEKVKDAIVNRLGGNFTEGEMTSLVNQLSDRELEIFQLVGDGYAAHEIADRLHLSIKTVASHRENIKRKLNHKSSEELTRFAIHWLRYRSTVSDQGTATPRQTPSRQIEAKSRAKSRKK